MLLKAHRRKKLQAAAFPFAWRTVLDQSVSVVRRLPPDDKSELESHTQVLLAEKNFEACGGLLLTSEMKLVIAAQACVLLLHRATDYFPGLHSILVYPSAYYAPAQRHLGSGIMHESHDSRLGECGGESIVLAWDAIEGCSDEQRHGRNLVLHEFAHQLDFEDGYVDGAPLLAPEKGFLNRKSSYQQWSKILSFEFEQLRLRLSHCQETILDPYGATNPAEFFAVTTEAFFENSAALQQAHPRLYEEFRSFYRQDPASW